MTLVETLLPEERRAQPHLPALAVATFAGDEWVEHYLETARGVRLPDPLPATIRDLLERDGTVAAMRQIWPNAPGRGRSLPR